VGFYTEGRGSLLSLVVVTVSDQILFKVI